MPVSGMFESLSAYPHWFVVACAALVAAVILWVLFLGLLVIAAVAAASVFLR